MLTLLYIFYVNDLYQAMPEGNIYQERAFIDNSAKGVLKLFVIVDIAFWVIGFISLPFWYVKFF
jgi:hypothetical protein